MPSCSPARTRVVLEPRKSDFRAGTCVNAYTGSGCCCCCCLHWIGAAAGAALGFRSGWRSGQADASGVTVARTRRAIVWGVVLGILLSVGLVVAFEEWLMVGLFAPSVVLLPAMGTMLAAAARAGFRLRSLYRAAQRKLLAAGPPDGTAYRSALAVPRATVPALDGVEMFCTECWDKLDNGEVALRCPACDAPIDLPAIPEARRGLRLAWHAGGKALLWSSLLTVAGYVVMWLLVVLF